MKNKNGFLLAEETLKIVIAVICIMFLVYFLTSLYFAKVNEEKLKYATETLKDSDESIESVIRVLEEAQTKQMTLKNPKAWYLFSFVGENKPNSCAEKNCLCICDNVNAVSYRSLWTSEEERQSEECAKDGVCLIVPDLKKFEEIEIKKDLTEILISKINNKIEILEK